MAADWQGWLERWDRQQELYRPQREAGIQAIVSAVAASAGDGQARVLDVACGCGSISARLLARLPQLAITAVDRDPVLLRIARGLFAGDPRVSTVAADLSARTWKELLGGQQFNAIVTATALHWLPATDVQRLYRDFSALLPAGGIFANLDWMPITGEPAIAAMAESAVRRHQEQAAQTLPATLTWDGWWDAIAGEPELTAELAQRRQLGGRSAEFLPAAAWHLQALRAAGFSEAAVVWRCFNSAVVAAVR